MTDTVTGVPAGFDFTDPDLYVERVPVEEFAARMRSDHDKYGKLIRAIGVKVE